MRARFHLSWFPYTYKLYYSRYTGVDSQSRNANTDDLDIHLGLLLVGLAILDLVHDVQSLHRTTKDSMFVVKPWRLLRCDEELTAVGVGSRIGHG